MKAETYAKKHGFECLDNDGEWVFVDPNMSWRLTLQGKKTSFGPLGGKSFEKRSHEDEECADAFTLGMLMSLVNLQKHC